MKAGFLAMLKLWGIILGLAALAYAVYFAMALLGPLEAVSLILGAAFVAASISAFLNGMDSGHL